MLSNALFIGGSTMQEARRNRALFTCPHLRDA
jgi:hypothetical protein